MYGTRSLAEACLKVAVDNIHLITSLGGIMPPQYLQTILRAVKTATQLHQLEVNSDDIYDETAKHWQRLITKDFRALSTQHNYVPQDRKSWHKVYDKYKKLQDEQIAAATEKLRQEFAAHDEHKHSRTSHIISGQQSSKLRPGKAKPGYNTPREKKTFIRKTRDQVRLEATRFNLRTATGKLIVPPGQINKKVAESRLHEARIASLPSAPHAPTIRPAAVKTASELDRERMEERLRRIKNSTESNSGTPANVIAFSDDENDAEPSVRSAGSKNKDDDLFGDLESDDLFGDLERKKTITPAVSSSKGPSVPRTAATQPAKRRRDAEETTTEQPAKRRRADEESAIRNSASTSATATSRLPQPATKVRRTKGLSAAPGANSALRAHKPAPPRTSTKTNAPPKSSATAPTRGQLQHQTPTKKTTPSKHSVATTVPDQPPRSDPPGPPVAPRHPLEPPVDDEPAKRVSIYGDGSVPYNPNDTTRRIPLHPGHTSQRRIQILRPNIWPKRSMK